MERLTGIGPVPRAWKAPMLPLNTTAATYIGAETMPVSLGFQAGYWPILALSETLRPLPFRNESIKCGGQRENRTRIKQLAKLI